MDYPGLGNVRLAVSQKNWVKAAMNLLAYYQTNGSSAQLRVCSLATNPAALTEANASLQSVFTFQGITDTLPVNTANRLNWFHKGPNNDIEWAYFLNRMGYVESLQTAYCLTSDATYARAFNRLIIDWVVSNPAPDTNWNTAPWRVLEVGLRLFGSWPTGFFGFQQATEFTPVARLLMLMSLHEHGAYVSKYHWVHHNHGVMELNGLTRLALCFPEFKQADEWYHHALTGMAEEFRFQSYPDGAMKELTNSYHWVVVRNFLAYLDLNKAYHKSIPKELEEIVKRMCDYMAYTARPDGYGLLNNDADLLNNHALLKPLLQTFPRPDWQYLLSHGKEGQRPAQTSMMFPWAGHFIMRNGWGEAEGKDHFAFFDNGPWGTSHQHNDKLHLSVYANGRELLCDAGRMYYKPDKWRQFVNLSASHNVIALDGRGQNNYVPEASKPLADSSYSIQPELDFSIGTYEGGFEDLTPHVPPITSNETAKKITGRHTRAVIYLKNRYWIVVDQVQSDKPRTLTAYWHFNPACSVIAEGQSVLTNDSQKGNLRFMPVMAETWSVNLVKGRENPSVQGWYSERYNQRVAACCAEYSTKMAGTSATFAWILYPSADEKLPEITAQLLPAPAGAIRLKVQIPGEKSVELALNMGVMQAVSLSNGFTLNGRCALLRDGKLPLVVQGKLSDKTGRVVVKN
ncbi:alginate lyase family protein [Larkinella sp. GY13]|uniref:alginate lyase family protein n=1 Tax=Larkinella sp. GY13 TaxID=3453720 RepID=UPI003EEE52CE